MTTNTRPTTDEDRAPLVEYLRGRATVTLTAEQDDIPVRGNALASGDDDVDHKFEDDILARLDDGNVWAWAAVTMTAEYLGHSGADHLGACSYANAEDFRVANDYYSGMVDSALDALAESILTDDGAYDDVTALADYFAGREQTAKPDAMNMQLIIQWQKFLAIDPIEHSDSYIDVMAGKAMSADWKGGPVEALVPGVAEEFCAVSERLGRLYDTDREQWQRVYDATRSLFKAGCDFGEALEALQEACHEGDVVVVCT